MLRGRRVGTLSAGVILLVFGVLFLLHLIIPGFSYEMVFSFWPIILIILGLEIILSYIINKSEKMKYDGGAILLVFVVSLFSMGMGITQFIFDNGYFYL